jgi:3-isopropylmalate dehydratase small subunit
MKLTGNVWKFGDNVDTDAIIAARYLNLSDPDELAKHCMEDLCPGFVRDLSPGDIIVAGNNFGCGSSREHAPLAIKHAQIAAVVACSFARIFYRNAFNTGLPLLECRDIADGFETGDVVEIDLENGSIHNRSRDRVYRALPIPPFMQTLLKAGGLIPFVQQRGYTLTHENRR